MNGKNQAKDGSESRPLVIILNASLANGEIHQILQLRRFCRVKVTQGTEANSMIIPVKSLAYMVLAITEVANQWPPSGEQILKEEIVKRIEKFYNIHRNSYLLLLARMTTGHEFLVLRELQRRFWKSPLIIYPVSSAKQCVRMLEQVSTLSKGTDDGTYNHLAKGHLEEEMAQSILEENLAITSHQSLVLLDGCQNIANVACSSAEELMERSPLSRDAAKKIHKFFENDCVSV